jgi:DNA-binding NarL/FixJ family response regulator
MQTRVAAFDHECGELNGRLMRLGRSVMQAGVEMTSDAKRSVVLIVDELELRRAGFASVVELWARAEHVVIDTVAPAALEPYAAQRGDVKLIVVSVGAASLDEPKFRSLAARFATLFPETPCAVISDRAEAAEAISAARLRMVAFLSTHMDSALVCQALTFVLGGGSYFPREALLESEPIHASPKRSPRDRESEPGALTRRQIEVLQGLALGQSNKVIARRLNMQESTVKVHVRQIMHKLGVTNRTQAALLAASVIICRLPDSIEASSAEVLPDEHVVAV